MWTWLRRTWKREIESLLIEAEIDIKGLEKWLGEFEINKRMKTIKITALLKSARKIKIP